MPQPQCRERSRRYLFSYSRIRVSHIHIYKGRVCPSAEVRQGLVVHERTLLESASCLSTLVQIMGKCMLWWNSLQQGKGIGFLLLTNSPRGCFHLNSPCGAPQDNKVLSIATNQKQPFQCFCEYHCSFQPPLHIPSSPVAEPFQLPALLSSLSSLPLPHPGLLAAFLSPHWPTRPLVSESTHSTGRAALLMDRNQYGPLGSLLGAVRSFNRRY